MRQGKGSAIKILKLVLGVTKAFGHAAPNCSDEKTIFDIQLLNNSEVFRYKLNIYKYDTKSKVS